MTNIKDNYLFFSYQYTLKLSHRYVTEILISQGQSDRISVVFKGPSLTFFTYLMPTFPIPHPINERYNLCFEINGLRTCTLKALLAPKNSPRLYISLQTLMQTLSFKQQMNLLSHFAMYPSNIPRDFEKVQC